jgi:hypothetical protein
MHDRESAALPLVRPAQFWRNTSVARTRQQSGSPYVYTNLSDLALEKNVKYLFTARNYVRAVKLVRKNKERARQKKKSTSACILRIYYYKYLLWFIISKLLVWSALGTRFFVPVQTSPEVQSTWLYNDTGFFPGIKHPKNNGKHALLLSQRLQTDCSYTSASPLCLSRSWGWPWHLTANISVYSI